MAEAVDKESCSHLLLRVRQTGFLTWSLPECELLEAIGGALGVPFTLGRLKVLSSPTPGGRDLPGTGQDRCALVINQKWTEDHQLLRTGGAGSKAQCISKTFRSSLAE